MKIRFDSNVVIRNFRTGNFAGVLEAGVARSQVFLSSVVAMELRAGCKTKAHTRAVRAFLRPFETAERVIAPSHAGCLRAGAAIAALGVRFGFDIQRRRLIANDALLAASAAEIGAAIITEDHSDFEYMARCIPVPWFPSMESFLAATPPR